MSRPPDDPSAAPEPRPGAAPDSRGGWSEPADPADPAAPPAPGPRYALGARLGEGGMGVVHAARDAVLGRDVALKAQKAGGGPGPGARLVREAALTSRLDHPGIMTVHDAGALPDGRPFYTMRLVRGQSLADALAAGPDAAARRRLVRAVLAAAEAVAAAHDAGVVHRDLKPANILLGPHGETQVADWGLAVPVPAAAGAWAGLPPLGERGPVGTSGYAAPEQAAGAPPDRRHDVYSLGRTLAAVLGPDAPAELEAVVARATDPDPAARYPDAAGLAEDLLAWFEGRRVLAHRYSPGELLRRTLRAWRAPLIAGLVGLLAVSAAVLGGWWQTSRSLDRALAAEAAAAGALAELRAQAAVRAAAAGARAEAEGLALLVLEHAEHPLARGVFAAFGRASRPALRAEAPAPACAWTALAPDGRALLCGADGALRLHPIGPGGAGPAAWTAPLPADAAAWDAHGLRAWTRDGALWRIDPATGAAAADGGPAMGDWTTQGGARAIWTAGGPQHARAGGPSGCEGRLLTAAAHADGRVAALCETGALIVTSADGARWASVPTEAQGDHVGVSLAWYGDAAVVIGTLRGQLLLVHAGTGARLARTATALGSISALAADPERRLVAAAGAEGGVALWRADAGALVGELPAARPRSFGFSAEGLVLVDGRLRVWSLPGGLPAQISGEAGFSQVAVDPGGAALVAVGGDGQVLELDLRTGEVRRDRFGDRVVKAAAWGPRGLAVTGLGGPQVGLRAGDGGGWAALPGRRPLRRIGWMPDGALIGADMDDGLYRWAALDQPPARRDAGRRFADLVIWGGRALALDTRGAWTWLAGAPPGAAAGGHTEGARALALGPRCAAIATASAVEVDCGEGPVRLDAGGERLLAVALSPDEALVAAGTLEGGVRVWDRAAGALLGRLPGHAERVVSVAFLPDGGLVSASWDHTLRLWDPAALRRPIAALRAEVEAATAPGPR